MGSGFPLRPSKWNTKQPIPRPFPKLVLVLVYVDGEILQKFGYAFVAGQEKKTATFQPPLPQNLSSSFLEWLCAAQPHVRSPTILGACSETPSSDLSAGASGEEKV
jgi:hypothetical protein